MNRWASIVVGAGLFAMVGGCAVDKSYPAPYGSDLEVSPVSVTTNTEGFIFIAEARVTNPELGANGVLLNNIQVAVKSGLPEGIVLIPESAIVALDDDYAVEQGSDAWAVDEAERYFQWTQVDETILPDYLETVTDSRGIARVYVYVRELPKAQDENGNEAIITGEYGIYFTIGVDAEVLTVVVEEIDSGGQ